MLPVKTAKPYLGKNNIYLNKRSPKLQNQIYSETTMENS